MKTKTVYICQECGAQSARWQGKCPSCNAWNSYVEETLVPSPGGKTPAVSYQEDPVLLDDISLNDEKRYVTGIAELDRVMGGGIVPGSVTLIGGDPGIGKSTLSLQIGCALSAGGLKVLYISGEESVKQTSMRAGRISRGETKSLYIVNQVDLNAILDYIKKMQPQVVVIDSIQVVYQPEVQSSPGSVSQVRECSAILTHTAKRHGIALFIIGHVTKEGMLAGPRVLEHIVDTVLYFEGERYSTYRILRGTKNRFGSTNEIGLFEMMANGLNEVPNPSEIFLSERPDDTTGSVVTPIIEGTRPFLVEVQGLVSNSNFNMVRQKAQGFDVNRLALLIAVLDKRLGLNMQDKDIFLNVVGGVKLMDPAADLAVALALATALLDKPVNRSTVVIGEVGLSGEVRSVSQVALRVNEARKLGFERCILPKNNLKSRLEIDTDGIEIMPVATAREALDLLNDIEENR
ncbi:MAG: DNA repair protein RadA [Candidatus Omnitrophica bacterium]|nr:DNA repair protein RadA [Candidatus Omnitrophota bacterium]MCB9719361.1 DNA repair protein RadA [Candidatus Omnitrophota bacterium]